MAATAVEAPSAQGAQMETESKPESPPPFSMVPCAADSGLGGQATASAGLSSCEVAIRERVQAATPASRLKGHTMTPDSAWQVLRAGNAAFAEGRLDALLLHGVGPQATPQARKELSAGQTPIATVLTCSDSRVPPELIFGAGAGTLFVVRNAGNVPSDETLGSLEYGACVLKTPLLIVMGHQGCGAVSAAVTAVLEAAAKAEGGSHTKQAPPAHIARLLEFIRPSAETAVSERLCETCGPKCVVEAAVSGNAQHTVSEILKRSTAIADRVAEGPQCFQVLTARYEMDSGLVTVL